MDITLHIAICGVSEQELYDNLDAELHEFANVQGVTYEEICVRLKEMYDGYKMGDKEIYNPWFILNYARRKVLVPYWVNTSANTMLKQAI